MARKFDIKDIGKKLKKGDMLPFEPLIDKIFYFLIFISPLLLILMFIIDIQKVTLVLRIIYPAILFVFMLRYLIIGLFFRTKLIKQRHLLSFLIFLGGAVLIFVGFYIMSNISPILHVPAPKTLITSTETSTVYYSFFFIVLTFIILFELLYINYNRRLWLKVSIFISGCLYASIFYNLITRIYCPECVLNPSSWGYNTIIIFLLGLIYVAQLVLDDLMFDKSKENMSNDIARRLSLLLKKVKK